jgi:uncharacterized OB-fold protein
MNAKKQIPCLEGWLTMPPEEPQLIGNRCGSCGHYFFPKAKTCRNPFCDKAKPLTDIKLSRKGELFAYTVNHYSPPLPYHAPDPFVPFAVVSIALPEGIKVGGQVPRDVDLDTLKVGMEMETVREVLYVDDDGNEVLSWMFRPAKS